MLKLRDIMTKDVVTVSPETTLRSAMELFSRVHVSGAPVVSGSHVVGVVSSTDLMALASSLPGVPRQRSELVGFDDEVDQTRAAAMDHDDEEPDAAYFTELWDDAGAEVSERLDATDGPEWDALSEHTVSEVMADAVYAMTPEADVAAAAEYMCRVGVHRLLVMSKGTLQGIVSTMDIARAVADRRLASRR